MKFTPEEPFQITEDNSLVYCLKSTGRYHKGAPEKINDVSLRVEMANPRHFGLRKTTQAEIARTICDLLNEKYPTRKDGD